MVDVICLLAGVFFFTSNVLRMVFVIRIYNRAHFEYDLMTNLDVGYLREQWKFRSDNLTLGNMAMVVNAFAWFFFLVPMLQLVWVLSKCGTRQVGVHAAIAVFCLVGCFGEVMSRLLLFGFDGVVHWISSEFELDFWLPSSISNGTRDELGWKALELVFLTIEGMRTWVDAFEWICLTAIFFLLFYSMATQAPIHRDLPMSMARVGLVIGLLALFDFAVDVLRYEDWVLFSRVALLINVLNTWILLPAFLVALSFKLPQLLPKPITLTDPSETIDLTAFTNDGAQQQQQQQQQEQGTTTPAPPQSSFPATTNASPPAQTTTDVTPESNSLI